MSRTGSARLVVAVVMLAVLAPSAMAQWYTRPYAGRYLKDDWSAQFLGGRGPFKKTVQAKDGIKVAYVQVWSTDEYTLKVNGQSVGQDTDGGTVEHFEITRFLKPGDNEIVLDAPGNDFAQAALEGEILYADGASTPIATDATWGGKASAKRTQGPRQAHHAVMLEYTARQRCEKLMANTRAAIQRINEQGLLELRGEASAKAILAGAPLDPPELTQSLAASSAETIKTLDAALVQMKAGQYDTAEPALKDAFAKMSAIEEQVEVARLARWSASMDAHLQRSAKALGVEAPGGLFKEPDASAGLAGWQGHAKALWDFSDKLSADASTYLSEPSWSRHNKFGWLTSCIPSDSDVGAWEFSIAPPEGGVIDLSGRWYFTTDPQNKGLQLGFDKAEFSDYGKWQRLQAGQAWEYQGVTQENSLSPHDSPFNADWAGSNKPYNGYAWYRTPAFIPASWRGGDVTLQIGRAQSWSWIYVNGKLAGEFTPNTHKDSENIRLVIPAELLKYGAPNQIAIRIYNVENQGGLNLKPVLLTSNKGGEMAELETRVGTCLYRGWQQGGQTHTAMLASALSPGAYVVTTRNELTLSNWEMRDVMPPNHLAMMVDGKLFSGDVNETGVVFDSAEEGEMTSCWMLIWHDVREGNNPRPVLVLLDEPAERVIVGQPSGGGRQITIVMPPKQATTASARPVYRFGLVRPFGDVTNVRGDLTEIELGVINRWVQAMRAYPVEYSELYKPSPDGAEVTFVYDYAKIADGFKTPALQIAPAPMLHSLGIASRNAGLTRPVDAQEMLPGGQWGGYWAVPTIDSVKLKAPPHSQALLRGASTTFMALERLPWLTAFQKSATWGANHVRCQIGFTIDWDMPLAKSLGDPITWEPKQVARLDAMIEAAKASGLQIMLNHFWGRNREIPREQYIKAVGPVPAGYDRPTVRTPDNSSRYWKINPASRQMVVDLWGRIAEHCKDLPPGQVSYDLLNEPTYVYTDDYNAFIADATRAIRAVDKTHMIVIEPGNGWAQPADFPTLKPTGDRNTMYSFHWYGEHNDLADDAYYPSYRTERGRYDRTRIEECLLDVIRFGIVNSVPVHCGETGLSILAPSRSADRWIQDYYEFCEKYDIHWSWWEYSNVDYWRTGLVARGVESPAVPLIKRFMNMNDRNGFHPEWYPHETPLMKEMP